MGRAGESPAAARGPGHESGPRAKHPRLDDWSWVTNADRYTAPELVTVMLRGRVTGHPHHTDGKVVTTSAVLGQRGGRVVTSSGTEYELGKPRKAYESNETLLARLPKLP